MTRRDGSSRGGLREALHGLSMQSRFMLTFGSVVVSLMIVVVVFATHVQSGTALEQIEKRGTAIARSLSTAATPALLSYDYSSMQRLADDLRSQTGAVYVVIHDKETAVGAYSGRPDRQGRVLDDTLSLWAVTVESPGARRHDGQSIDGIEASGLEILEVATPVRLEHDTTRWGTVRVGLSLAEMHAQVSVTRRTLTLLGVLAVGIVLLSARLFTQRITGPLRELSVATARVASGELDQRLDENLVGELGEAAKSFNKMTQDLRRTHDALRYQKQHLENMVQERTGALRQKARELESANRELKEVDRLKSDFLSNVSHELRTPLTSIRSFTEILADDMGVSPAEQQEFLGIIASQTDRLTRLIGDLLDLSKIEAGEFHCNVDTVPLGSLVLAPCMETVRRMADDLSITIEDFVDGDLPEVLGDSDRLSQVTVNLLDNAIKFTEPGGRIRLRAFASPHRVPPDVEGPSFRGVVSDTPDLGAYVVVAIEDDGQGIPPTDQQRIFEKFGQSGNVLTEKPQGTGLGLAISASIMAQHGGALWVESTPGEGSTFLYSVPVSAQAEHLRQFGGDSGRRSKITQTVTPAPDQDAMLRALDQCTDGTRVLVVDDDLDRIARVTATLEPLGYRALGCEGGTHAADRAREVAPDAIVLNANLRDLNGYEVLRRLKQERATVDVPVVVIGPAEEARRAYELGAAVHVPRVEGRSPVSGVLA